MERRILVTGGAGFIGSNFIRHLLRTTHDAQRMTQIVNLDKLTYSGNLENLKDIEKDQRYEFVKGDICDSKLVEKLAKESDVIINFAAESHVDRSIKDPSSFIKANITGTQVLLDAAREFKLKRYIQVSTDEVYGSVAEGYSDEEAPLRPNSPYAASKAAADLLCRSYYVTYKTPVVITRSSNNFGPYQYPEKVIPLFITNILTDKKVPLYADGSNVRDWIYVEDNCSAIAFVTEKGKAGEVYNVGGSNEVRNIDLTKKILGILKKDESLIEFVKDRPGHDRRYALNSSKLENLGWRPGKESLDKKLEDTINWYKENPKWWKRLKKEEKFW
jgi:dTDP-glucose 4,6-dehydratase